MIDENDTFPLWSFGYMVPPITDRKRTMTSRGRTWREALHQIQGESPFLEPEKVGLMIFVRLSDKLGYDTTHPYNWLHDAPLWLKIQEGATDKIW